MIKSLNVNMIKTQAAFHPRALAQNRGAAPAFAGTSAPQAAQRQRPLARSKRHRQSLVSEEVKCRQVK
jgi:hypothetical protein